ncbi:MAG: immunity protein 19, partial [Clostridia bacterium]|nr:immunity protein 19 [Clostridia bacterium]
MKQIDVTDIGFDNLYFWQSFFRAEWQNAYHEQEDLSLPDIMDEYCPELDECLAWWHEFTQYDDYVMEQSDGYLDQPTTLEAALGDGQTLAIAFHPGDTVYFINGREIGCTGPHPIQRQPLPYESVKELLSHEYGEQLFFLLLPMAVMEKNEAKGAKIQIQSLLTKLFPKNICGDMAQCIVCALTKEERGMAKGLENNKKLLLFHMDEGKASLIKTVCHGLDIRVVKIYQPQYGEKIGALAGIPIYAMTNRPYTGDGFTREMMVICGLNGEELDA